MACSAWARSLSSGVLGAGGLGGGQAALQLFRRAAVFGPAQRQPDAFVVFRRVRAQAAQDDEAQPHLLHQPAGNAGQAGGGQLGGRTVAGGQAARFVRVVHFLRPVEHAVGGGGDALHQAVAGGEFVGEQRRQHARAAFMVGGAGQQFLGRRLDGEIRRDLFRLRDRFLGCHGIGPCAIGEGTYHT